MVGDSYFASIVQAAFEVTGFDDSSSGGEALLLAIWLGYAEEHSG
jgi:hypothetical protein